MFISLKSIAIVGMTAGLTGVALNAAIDAGEEARALSSRIGSDKFIYIDSDGALVCPKPITARTYCTSLDGETKLRPALRR